MAAFKEYTEYDGLGLAELIRNRDVAAEEILDAAIERIEAHNPRLNAVVTKSYEQARAALAELPAKRPFAGVPFLLKDLGGAQAGVRLTGGSRFFEDAVAPFDAEIVRRYRGAGLLILGRTNTPELGLSATTEPVLFGPARNPFDVARTPGGSSGGSAAAVASGMVPLAHASDGGGSIRIPAACCGLFGLKPTRGRNSMAPYAGESLAGCSIEHVISRSVRDSAAALDATRGPVPGDPYFAPPPARPYREEAGAGPGRLRIALATRAFNGGPVTPACVEVAKECARLCADLGHEVDEAAPDYDAHALDEAYNRVFAVGAAANVRIRADLMKRPVDPARFERVTWAMIEQARAITAPEYVQLIHRLHAISRQVAAFFERYDLLLTPALAEPPVELGVLDMMSDDLEAYASRLWRFTPFTYVFNVTGQPAMSVPFWRTEGLPSGVQFAARYGDEATLFRLAGQLEEARPWAHRLPPVSA